jgi:hypothetical protein
MAKRIYDQTLGQLAGVQVTTDGLGNIVRDGTEAYAQMTVSASGQPIASTAGTGNLVSLSGATVAAGSISFSANNQYAIIDTQGFEGASFTVSGFGTATLAVQWSNLAASGFVAGTVSTVGSSTTGTTITANGQYTAASGGRYMKVLVTAFTTGPIVVTPVLIAGSSVGGSGGGAAGDVNLTQVAGTAVTAGAGAVTAGTQRTTLASDDPAVVALQAMQAATGPVLIPSAGTPVKGLTAAANTQAKELAKIAVNQTEAIQRLAEAFGRNTDAMVAIRKQLRRNRNTLAMKNENPTPPSPGLFDRVATIATGIGIDEMAVRAVARQMRKLVKEPIVAALAARSDTSQFVSTARAFLGTEFGDAALSLVMSAAVRYIPVVPQDWREPLAREFVVEGGASIIDTLADVFAAPIREAFANAAGTLANPNIFPPQKSNAQTFDVKPVVPAADTVSAPEAVPVNR